MAATMTQIAAKAGVSLALVSRFLNEDPTLRISAARRDRILNAKASLGGLKRPRGRMNGGAPRSVGHVVIPTNKAFPPTWIEQHVLRSQLYDVLEQRLRGHGIRISIPLFDAENVTPFFRELLEDEDYCGGIVLPTQVITEDIASLLLDRHRPHVCIDMEAEHFGVNTVCDSVAHGFHLIMRHLRARGHTRVAFLGPPSNRFRIFRDVAAAMGFEDADVGHCELGGLPSPSAPVMDWTTAAGAFGLWLDANPETTALVCHNDEIAIAAIASARARNIKVGCGFSVVGYGASWARERADDEPRLTSVAIPYQRIAERVAARLIEQIQDNSLPVSQERVPVSLVVGETT